MKKKILNWLYVILWLGVIYWFSNQPHLKSELTYAWDLVFRKIAHMAEYFVLTFLYYKALNNYKINFNKILLYSLMLTILSAIMDEFHQSFIAGRTASAFDVLVDSVGAIILIMLMIKKRYESLFNKQPL
ncbi:VanZ family protein [Patescibacteria group bacterium]|nr:VanZ family protein [Patescibacteria group bacterium]